MSLNLIEKQVIYRGKKLRLEVHHLEDEMEQRHQREVVAHPGAVVLLPWLDEQQILLIRNYRYAVGQILLELPAGTMNKDEDPINCAGRELLEETGYLAGRLRQLFAFYASPGISSERIYAYAAYDLEQSEPSLEAGEEIEVVPTPYAEALEMIRTGEIHDGKSIATLLWFERYGRGPEILSES
jgi:ADP-ribose pyrophosphatase